MKPTLDEMKAAVAKMLPGVLYPNELIGGAIAWEWVDCGEYVSEREWLHVCRLAEVELFDPSQALETSTKPYTGIWAYLRKLEEVCVGKRRDELSDAERLCLMVRASAEHRIEALCRVKCPEMFTEPNL